MQHTKIQRQNTFIIKDKDTLVQVNITHSFKKTCKYNNSM